MVVGASPLAGANTDGAVVGVPGVTGAADAASPEPLPVVGAALGTDGFLGPLGLGPAGSGAATSGSSSEAGLTGAAASLLEGESLVGACVAGEPLVGAWVAGEPEVGAAVDGGAFAGAAVVAGGVAVVGGAAGAGSEPEARNSCAPISGAPP